MVYVFVLFCFISRSDDLIFLFSDIALDHGNIIFDDQFVFFLCLCAIMIVKWFKLLQLVSSVQ